MQNVLQFPAREVDDDGQCRPVERPAGAAYCIDLMVGETLFTSSWMWGTQEQIDDAEEEVKRAFSHCGDGVEVIVRR